MEKAVPAWRNDLRVALVHDWLTGMRGGEKLLLELCRLFPQATVHTMLWNPGSVHPEIEQRIAEVSFLRRLPGAAHGYRNFLPLYPAAIRSLRLPPVDLVLSTSHAVAKAVRAPAGALHVSYIHTPMRYLWGFGGDHFRFGAGAWWKRAALAAVKPYLKNFDLRTAANPDYLIANSRTVQLRVSQVWGREAEVIHPPVDTDFFTPSPAPPEDYYLVVSPFEPYKRVDLVLAAFAGLDRRLVVAGGGTLERDLRAAAGPNVELAGRVSDDRLRDLYRRCRAFLFPVDEDFGMTPVEAQACGRPVIAYAAGGATETVVDGETGVLFQPQTLDGLRAAMRRLESLSFDAARCREQSLRFSVQRFRARMETFLAGLPGPSSP
jgi:glycosyltransferase involved in cell wall biosynthesis